MCFAQRVVEFQSLQCCGFGFGIDVAWRITSGGGREERIGIGESGVCQCIIWIKVNRLLKMFDTFFDPVGRAFVGEVPAF